MVLKVDYPSAAGFLEDYTANIRQGFIIIRIGRKLAEGDHVELLLSFPGLLSPISLKGEVRWVQEEELSDLGVGVALDEQAPELWSALDSLVDRIRQGDKTLIAPTLRVLVVEDNPHLVRLLSDGLSTCGKRSSEPIVFETRHAANGKEALDLLESESFDVLLVDMYLPVMDGETLIKKARVDPRWTQLPIVAISAGGKDARDRSLAAGADFFLDKPLRLSDVLATMRHLESTIH